MASNILPPHSIEAEQGALGCVLLSQPSEARRLLSQIEARHLYDERSRLVWRSLVSLDATGEPLDPVALGFRLKALGELQEGDGKLFAESLPDKTPSAGNFPTYLATLDDYATRRRMLREAADIESKALNLAQPVAETTRNDSIREKLALRRFNFAVKPEHTEPRFLVGQTPVCTPGNLTTISAQAKQGKTAAMTAAQASTMSLAYDADCLGWKSSNAQGFAVVSFDTEQSIEDHDAVSRRAIARAALTEAPAWFLSYCLTGFSVAESRTAIRVALEDAAIAHGGIHSVFLDGAADLVADVNDPAESNEFVAHLHATAIEYACPIITAIHLNPGSDFKTRGHLGSQLERKAETNLKLERDGDAIIMFAEKNRKAPILRTTGPRFVWSDEAGMHVSTESAGIAKNDAKREALASLMEGIFTDRKSMRYTDVILTVKKSLSVSQRTAERKTEDAAKLRVIEKSVAGLWIYKGL